MDSEKNETFDIEGDMNRVDIGAGANVGAIAVGREIHQTIHHHQSPQAVPTPPAPELIQAYLKQVAAQKPYMLWTNQTYINRNVAKSDDIFSRTVARFDPRTRKEKPKPELLEDALAREWKLVLVGEPGQGKTTSLLHLAWEAANRALASQRNFEVPIYIELKNYNGEPELETLLAHRVNQILLGAESQLLAFDLSESTRILKIWLGQKGARLLLLLDGLNEVRPEFHVQIREAIQTLLKSQNRIVISCREREYDESLQHSANAYVLQGLGGDDIVKYLRRTLNDKGENLFLSQIRGDEKMETLSANPLMLWLVATVAQSDPQTRLPANRGMLFQRFVAIMPRLRSREGIRAEVSLDVVITTLMNISYEMQSRGLLSINLSEVRDWQIMTGGKSLEEVLAEAKNWRFLKSDGQMGEPVEFLHQLFQEYFAAEYFRQRLDKRQDYDSILGEHPFAETWNETIVMLAGIYDEPVDLVMWLSERIIERKDSQTAFLLQQCWETTAAVKNDEARRAVVNALTMVLNTHSNTTPAEAYAKAYEGAVEMWTEVSIVDQTMAVDAVHKSYASLSLVLHTIKALGKIGDEQAIKSLIIALRNPNADTRWTAAEVLGETRNIESVEPLIAALHDSEAGVRGEAALALGKIRDTRAIKPLIELLQDVSIDVSERAESALVGIGTPAVKSLIAALNNEDTIARGRAVSALGLIGDQRALPKLEQMVQNDECIMWQGRKVADAARIAADAILLGKQTSVK